MLCDFGSNESSSYMRAIRHGVGAASGQNGQVQPGAVLNLNSAVTDGAVL
jgi:hypothetical protein